MDGRRSATLEHLAVLGELTDQVLPLADLPEVLRNGGIDHALVVAALYAFELWRARR